MNPDNVKLTLSEVVDKLRSIARDGLRMIRIADYKRHLHDLNLAVKTLEKDKAEYLKDVERNKFAVSKIDPADPDAKENEESLNKSTERTQKAVESVDNAIKTNSEQISKVNENIAKWESGENLVCKEELADETNRLLAIYVSNQATKI